MKTNVLVGIICLGITFIFCNSARSEFRLNTDTNYSINIAVTVNEKDNIVGKLEYSKDWLQLVTFTRVGDKIYSEPYLFEIIERTIVSKYIHKVRLQSLNDKYSAGEVTGAIDFSDEVHPKVRLVTTGLVTYIGNISENGKNFTKCTYQTYG